MRVEIFKQKFRNFDELQSIKRAAIMLDLKYEIDEDAREFSLDDPLYEIIVYMIV
jgi:hypothetical protein